MAESVQSYRAKSVHFSLAVTESIAITKTIFNELDSMKNVAASASLSEKMWAREAREAFHVLDETRATIVEPTPQEVFAKYDLSDSPEEQVIASYLHYRDSQDKKVLFLTLEEELLDIAKRVGLESAEFNIKKFIKQRERELQVMTNDEIIRGKKVNPIHRFFRRCYFLHQDIKRIGKIIVYTIIILVVIASLVSSLVYNRF